MQEIISYIEANKIIQFILLVPLLTFMLFFMTKILRQMLESTITMKTNVTDKRKEKLFKTLIEGFKINAINSLDDVINIYKGISGLSTEDLDYKYGLSRRLRQFLVELLSKNLGENLDDNLIAKVKNEITDFIKTNEINSPYSDLPTAERNALYDLTDYLERNEVDSSKRKVVEIAGMIQARNDDLNKIKNINKWTVPLSIVGLVLTIVFGVLALIK
jgi:hypothetical protein